MRLYWISVLLLQLQRQADSKRELEYIQVRKRADIRRENATVCLGNAMAILYANR